ncbi:HAD family phosphatase [Candidatus Peregrinibacteria bacterium]|nr:HAD family phosphatase [Candidatus Peregrinibacteria bacterium]
MPLFKEKKRFKVIVFDLGGVVFTNSLKQFIHSLSERYSLEPSRINEVINSGGAGTAYRENRITRNQFWENVLKTLPFKESADELEQEWIEGYHPMPGMKELLADLAKKYKIYYLSDSVKERVEALEAKYHFTSWFDGGLFSYEVGARKPSQKMYESIIQKAGVSPEAMFFIDDKASSLEPAKKMGMATILFLSVDQLKKELKKSTIEFRIKKESQ